MPTKALFLDRDGVINIDTGYVYRPEDFHLVPGIIDLCRAAQEAGYLIVVVTNQSGIARSMFSEEDFSKLLTLSTTVLFSMTIILTANQILASFLRLLLISKLI
jgi:HAD superfamily hydrolase (TIGR01662 family)